MGEAQLTTPICEHPAAVASAVTGESTVGQTCRTSKLIVDTTTIGTGLVSGYSTVNNNQGRATAFINPTACFGGGIAVNLACG